MSFKSYLRYTLQCVGCGDELDDLYEDELDAEEAGLDVGWTRATNGDHHCKDCTGFDEESA